MSHEDNLSRQQSAFGKEAWKIKGCREELVEFYDRFMPRVGGAGTW